MSVPITKTTDFLSAVSRTLNRGVCRHYWKRVFPGLRNGCKNSFFSLFLAVFLGIAKTEKMDLANIDLNKQRIKEANRTASIMENSAKNGLKSAEEKMSTIKQARLDQSIKTKNYNMEIKKAEESLARNASTMKRFTKIARVASKTIPIASAAIELTFNRMTQNNPWGRDLLTVGVGTVAAIVAGSLVSGLILSWLLLVVTLQLN